MLSIFFIIADAGFADAFDVIKVKNALNSGDPSQIEAAKISVIDAISSPHLGEATEALKIISEKEIKEALPRIKQKLSDVVGARGGGGSEMQALRQLFLEALWGAFVQLADDKTSLDPRQVPSRSQLEKILQREKK